MNLIDRDKIPYREYLGDDEPRVYKSQIDALPTVEAVPVVRCGECEYWQNDSVHIYGMCENPNIGNVKLDTDFCSYGERKDDTHE